ncbi:MAG: Ger(x)C family spore germination protein [Bacillota bacterium]|nr:Ger(x)C family spore germination protein [Bacillota bacterium]
MISRYYNMIWLLIIPLFLTGCWDYRDVNKRSINLSVGVDDVNGNVLYGAEFAKLMPDSSRNSSGMAQVSGVYYLESLGENFEDSRSAFESQLPFQDFTGPWRVITFSEKYAENEGIEAYINRTYNIQTFRNSVLMTICKGSVRELFNSKINNDVCTGYGIEDTIKCLDDSGGTLYKTSQQVKSDIDFKSIGFLLPYITKENGTIKYLGLAVMKNSKLIRIIDRKESTGFLFLLSKNPNDIDVISHPRDENISISTKTTLGKKHIKTSYKDKKIHINIDLKLNSQIQYEYYAKPISNEDMKKIESEISKKIKKAVISSINLSQNEFKSDVFGFARCFKAENPIEYRNMDWIKEYTDAVFDVNVETTIKNTNLIDLKK